MFGSVFNDFLRRIATMAKTFKMKLGIKTIRQKPKCAYIWFAYSPVTGMVWFVLAQEIINTSSSGLLRYLVTLDILLLGVISMFSKKKRIDAVTK